jgi:murein L,D-transpeptidase YafK
MWKWGLLLWAWALMAVAQKKDEVWLLVDTKKLVLHVMQGDKVIESFDHISIGSRGVTRAKRRGDHKTPLGVFRIAWIKESSRYYRFFGLNYPTLSHATRGWLNGWLDDRTYRSLIRASFESTVPPQDTPLGGFVGIHGVGKADRSIHGMFNWTQGCIALTDAQIDRLSRWIKVGTTVVIR